MSEIKNSRLGLYGAEHSKCNHMMILGFNGLTSIFNRSWDITPSLLIRAPPLFQVELEKDGW